MTPYGRRYAIIDRRLTGLQGICQTAVDDIGKRLEALPCSDGSIVALVQFRHQSPGLLALRQKIAEALVMAISERHNITLRDD